MIKLSKICSDGIHRQVNFKQWTFPGGELGVKIDTSDLSKSDYHYTLEALMPNNLDLQVMYQIMDILNRYASDLTHKRNSIGQMNKVRLTLRMPYLPYARQDRVCNPGESFALELFINTLALNIRAANHLKIDLIIDDVHSAVSKTLLKARMINYVETQSMRDFIQETPEQDKQYYTLVFPDAGALKRYTEIGLGAGFHTVSFNKTRDNGKVVYEPAPKDTVMGKMIIVDDICDGGATFIALADMLRDTQHVDTLGLCVTHGIFSAGKKVLESKFDSIHAMFDYSV